MLKADECCYPNLTREEMRALLHYKEVALTKCVAYPEHNYLGCPDPISMIVSGPIKAFFN